jgi:hypothetical protein
MERMLMAWKQVRALTINNHWEHTKYQGFILKMDDYLIYLSIYSVVNSYKMVYMRHLLHTQPMVHGTYLQKNFATSITLLAAKEQLKTHLGN